MTRNKTIGLCVVLAGVVALAVWLMRPPAKLSYQGKSVDEWLIESASDYPHRNEQAIEALRQMGEPAVQHLIWRLENEDPEWKLKLAPLVERFPKLGEVVSYAYWYRFFAAKTLGALGTNASSAIPALEEMSRDPNRNLGRVASAALVLVRNEPIEPYIELYRDYKDTNSVTAFGILMELGPAAKSAVPVLLEELESTNSRIRIRALDLIKHVGFESPECIGPLMRELNDENQMARRSAISALANFGNLARPVIAQVVTNLGDKDAGIRSSTLMFIRFVPSDGEFESLRPLVQRAVSDPDPGVSGMAEWVLRERQRPSR